MKIALNKCFGGFSFSEYFTREYNHRYNGEYSSYDLVDMRDTAEVVALMEELTPAASSGPCARLTLVDIPDTCTDFDILEFDGHERVVYVVDGTLRYA